MAAQEGVLAYPESDLGPHGIPGDDAVMELQDHIFTASLAGVSGAEPSLDSIAGIGRNFLVFAEPFSVFICGFCEEEGGKRGGLSLKLGLQGLRTSIASSGAWTTAYTRQR